MEGSARPLFTPSPIDDGGEAFGIQARGLWRPGDNKPVGLIDARRARSLWRVSVFGPVVIDLTYGSKGNRTIVGLAAPLVMSIPGQLTLTARPLDTGHATDVLCIVTLTEATAAARGSARLIADATGGALDLDPGSVSFFALTASTLTIRGIAIAVPALSAVPLVTGSRLLTGSGYQEYEA